MSNPNNCSTCEHLTARTLDRGFENFWRQIMPPFQTALRLELEKAAAQPEKTT